MQCLNASATNEREYLGLDGSWSISETPRKTRRVASRSILFRLGSCAKVGSQRTNFEQQATAVTSRPPYVLGWLARAPDYQAICWSISKAACGVADASWVRVGLSGLGLTRPSAALRHVGKRHELVIVPIALRYPYLCSTVHVAHAHRMRGYWWADDPAAIQAMAAFTDNFTRVCLAVGFTDRGGSVS